MNSAMSTLSLLSRKKWVIIALIALVAINPFIPYTTIAHYYAMVCEGFMVPCFVMLALTLFVIAIVIVVTQLSYADLFNDVSLLCMEMFLGAVLGALVIDIVLLDTFPSENSLTNLVFPPWLISSSMFLRTVCSWCQGLSFLEYSISPVMPVYLMGMMLGSCFVVVFGSRIAKYNDGVWSEFECKRYLNSIVSENLLENSVMLVAPSKDSFRNQLKVFEIKYPEQHPHPHCAAYRNAASYAIDDFIYESGYEPYCLGSSSREKELAGERFMYSTRDFALEMKCDPIDPKVHFIKIIDTDYYYDMPSVLLLGLPVLISTYVPQSAGSNDSDGSYVMSNNKVVHMISGGGRYEHELWDYNHDFLSVTEAVSETHTKVIVFEVDQMLINPKYCDHRIIYFKPIRSMIVDNLYLSDVRETRLERHRFSKGEVNYVQVGDSKGLWYSLSLDSRPLSVTVEVTEFLAIWSKKSKSLNFNPGDVQRVLGPDSKHEASYLADILSSPDFDVTMLMLKPINAYAPTVKRNKAINYEVKHDSLTPAKEVGRTFGPSVMAKQPVIAAKCIGNDTSCIEERINKPSNKKQPPPRYKAYASEFVAAMVPSTLVGKGVPIDMADVMDKQTAPAQKARAAKEKQFLDCPKPFKVSAFQKDEFYGKVGAPRNISQTPTGHMIKLSTFTASFKKDVLRNMDWYMPTRSPVETAARLNEFVQNHDSVLESDFSRFDGSASQFLQVKVVIAAYLRWVSDQYYNELHDLLYAELKAKGVTEFLVNYDTGYSVLSGSAKTTDGNCQMNAFTSYVAHREAGKTHEEAWELIGLIYGDDNVTVGKAEDLERVCGDLGLSVKVKTVEKHGSVGYIGRIFIDPWTTTTSYQDLDRTLTKFVATSSNQTVPIEAAAYNKVSSYLVSDSKTPVLAALCRQYSALYIDGSTMVLNDVQKMMLEKDKPWVARSNNSWPQNEGDENLLLEVCASRLNLAPNDLVDYERRLLAIDCSPATRDASLVSLRELGTLDGPDRFVHVELKSDVYVDNELYTSDHSAAPADFTDMPRLEHSDGRGNFSVDDGSVHIVFGSFDSAENDTPSIPSVIEGVVDPVVNVSCGVDSVLPQSHEESAPVVRVGVLPDGGGAILGASGGSKPSRRAIARANKAKPTTTKTTAKLAHGEPIRRVSTVRAIPRSYLTMRAKVFQAKRELSSKQKGK